MATLRDFNRIVELGFDKSSIPARARRDGTRPIRVACSRCESLVINGMATHEHGCPNATAECRGCDAVIPIRQRYCQECES